jgi:hypothetical protein
LVWFSWPHHPPFGHSIGFFPSWFALFDLPLSLRVSFHLRRFLPFYEERKKKKKERKESQERKKREKRELDYCLFSLLLLLLLSLYTLSLCGVTFFRRSYLPM